MNPKLVLLSKKGDEVPGMLKALALNYQASFSSQYSVNIWATFSENSGNIQ
jgi:hypothetical protein